nr:transcription initiation factor TFIID subunit 4-like [Aegilops tauschii subsp. strangulata]
MAMPVCAGSRALPAEPAATALPLLPTPALHAPGHSLSLWPSAPLARPRPRAVQPPPLLPVPNPVAVRRIHGRIRVAPAACYARPHAPSCVALGRRPPHPADPLQPAAAALPWPPAIRAHPGPGDPVPTPVAAVARAPCMISVRLNRGRHTEELHPGESQSPATSARFAPSDPQEETGGGGYQSWQRMAVGGTGSWRGWGLGVAGIRGDGGMRRWDPGRR